MLIIIAFVLGFALGNNIDKLCEKKKLFLTSINTILCILGIIGYIYMIGSKSTNWHRIALVLALALFVISYAAHD